MDSEGRRCQCRTRLELDHIQPRALDGRDDASNLRGLVNMGFGASAVNETLLALVGRHRDAGAPPLLELLREAIAALA